LSEHFWEFVVIQICGVLITIATLWIRAKYLHDDTQETLLRNKETLYKKLDRNTDLTARAAIIASKVAGAQGIADADTDETKNIAEQSKTETARSIQSRPTEPMPAVERPKPEEPKT
jgi:hypothetical protein